MKAGVLNTRCRIENKSVTRDPVYGTELVSWVTVATVWCHIQDELPSKSEAVKQGLAVATRRSRVRMRYRTGIDSSMRLVINWPTETTFQIVGGPAILGNRDGLELFVEKYSS
jgi:head-tail adaptor